MSPNQTPLPYGSAAPWWGLTLGLGVLGLLELLAGHLIVQHVLGETSALVFDVVLGTVTAALLVTVASPLWASPHIDHVRAEVVADLGLLGSARIPLAAISSATEHHPTVLEQVGAGAMVTGDPPRATFSRGGGGGFVLLELRDPVVARHSLRRHQSAVEVLIQAADPSSAITAITAAMPETPAHG